MYYGGAFGSSAEQHVLTINKKFTLSKEFSFVLNFNTSDIITVLRADLHIELNNTLMNEK